MFTRGIAIVTRKTRLKGLIANWGTKGQAKFRMKQAHLIEQERALPRDKQGLTIGVPKLDVAAAEEDFEEYEREDGVYQRTVDKLEKELNFGLPLTIVDRDFLPNFGFETSAAVVVVGQDGLVANAAKYVGDLPIVAVNPDPARIDGILLPFQPAGARRAVGNALEGKARVRQVTLAEVSLNDGQRMLAFNDFFIGASSHVSARYTLEVDGRGEPQSSSGVLVSTGAGSTGWLSSVFNMADGLAAFRGGEPGERLHLSWDDRRLAWAVREPFASKHSQATLVAGLLDEGHSLVLESQMPSGGVIFSDGVEADYLHFNTGGIARISAAQQRARLVVG